MTLVQCSIQAAGATSREISPRSCLSYNMLMECALAQVRENCRMSRHESDRPLYLACDMMADLSVVMPRITYMNHRIGFDERTRNLHRDF